jgi:hypothetical protein
MKDSRWGMLHCEHYKLRCFASSLNFAAFFRTEEPVSFFSVVRSGEQVRLHEGGESVLCIIIGGFEWFSLLPRGASSCLGLEY